MLVDTHCHLDSEDYDNIEQVIANMGINIMIASRVNRATNENVLRLVDKYPNIYGTIGIHPTEVSGMENDDLSFIERNLNHHKIVGIGEIGLDYYWEKNDKELQKKIFIKQLKLADKYHKTVVIHSRDAIDETYQILNEYLGSNKVVLHAYSSSSQMAKKFKKFNIKFGIGGVVTFKNATKLKEVVNTLSLSDIVLETDSPYLTPVPFRGQRNEPVNVKYVASFIAKLKGVDDKKIAKITTNNALCQFDIKV